MLRSVGLHLQVSAESLNPLCQHYILALLVFVVIEKAGYFCLIHTAWRVEGAISAVIKILVEGYVYIPSSSLERENVFQQWSR